MKPFHLDPAPHDFRLPLQGKRVELHKNSGSLESKCLRNKIYRLNRFMQLTPNNGQTYATNWNCFTFFAGLSGSDGIIGKKRA